MVLGEVELRGISGLRDLAGSKRVSDRGWSTEAVDLASGWDN